MKREISRSRIQLAWGLAILVDALQILAGPANFALPLAWFIGVGLDIITMILMWILVGWHWAFLPSFVVEVFPIVEIAPAWTVAVFLATRGAKRTTAEREASLPPKEGIAPDSSEQSPLEDPKSRTLPPWKP